MEGLAETKKRRSRGIYIFTISQEQNCHCIFWQTDLQPTCRLERQILQAFARLMVSLVRSRVDDASGLLANPENATVPRRKRVGYIDFAIHQRLGRSLAMNGPYQLDGKGRQENFL
jgi:hypothetical protein